ncbi:hypothetical protein K7432_013540 [Basidiobolus ranarum]|uniref:Uncharacterized protein n=1 Tax=Basidiobolus ranarum TaxID=34480 RepID=A0ABR2VQU7_9FUNG
MFFLSFLRSHTFLLLVTLATVVVAQSTSVDDITTTCGPNIYCLPLEGALWLPQQNRFVRWNSKYPTFAVAGFVNISLYNTQSTNPVRQWPLYENAEGLLAINSFDSNWFIGAALVQKFYFIILGPNDNPSLAQLGPVFSIQSSLSSTASPTTSITNSASPTSNPKPSGISSGSFPTGTSGTRLPDHESGGLSVGAICGIAVGSVLLVTAVA